MRGQRLHVDLRGKGDTFRGLAVPTGDGGMLLNLSFGIRLIDAVRQHALTDADFAATDMAVEMLYLVEVKQAVMTELRRLNLRLQGAKATAEEQALTDTLTGLRNRRALDVSLPALIGQGVAFGLMHIDLDYFKQVNDTLGHAAGDQVLRRSGEGLGVGNAGPRISWRGWAAMNLSCCCRGFRTPQAFDADRAADH